MRFWRRRPRPDLGKVLADRMYQEENVVIARWALGLCTADLCWLNQKKEQANG